MRPRSSLWITFSHTAAFAAGCSRSAFSSTRPASRSAASWHSVQYCSITAPFSAASCSADGPQPAASSAAASVVAPAICLDENVIGLPSPRPAVRAYLRAHRARAGRPRRQGFVVEIESDRQVVDERWRETKPTVVVSASSGPRAELPPVRTLICPAAGAGRAPIEGTGTPVKRQRFDNVPAVLACAGLMRVSWQGSTARFERLATNGANSSFTFGERVARWNMVRKRRGTRWEPTRAHT